MNILMLGDVTDIRTVSYLKEKLIGVRRARHIDFVTANAENACFITGANPETAEALLDAGIDVLTGGNHTLQCHSIHPYLEDSLRMLRPVNYPATVPGSGYTIADASGYRMLVINALGVVDMQPVLDNPFTAVDRVLKREEGHYDFAMLDFHAEATGEKVAMGRYLDGRVHIIAGTHTHVPTADHSVLPGGSGYVTDLGMCGPTDGVLGIKTKIILARNVDRMPARFEPAEGDIRAEGVLFTLNTAAGRVEKTERISF